MCLCERKTVHRDRAKDDERTKRVDSREKKGNEPLSDPLSYFNFSLLHLSPRQLIAPSGALFSAYLSMSQLPLPSLSKEGTHTD